MKTILMLIIFSLPLFAQDKVNENVSQETKKAHIAEPQKESEKKIINFGFVDHEVVFIGAFAEVIITPNIRVGLDYVFIADSPLANISLVNFKLGTSDGNFSWGGKLAFSFWAWEKEFSNLIIPGIYFEKNIGGFFFGGDLGITVLNVKLLGDPKDLPLPWFSVQLGYSL